MPLFNPPPLVTNETIKHSWSVDFMHDALVFGRRIWIFNVVNHFDREALAIEIGLNISVQRVVRVVDRIVATRIICGNS
ncbi:hypothetical protein CG432_08600 [Pantoea ananatis]|nr:hypothetical protein CG432_08600 [Pantoea ananatis]